MVSLPLLAALQSQNAFGLIDALGVALWLIGMGFEVIGDAQLAAFRADAQNRGRVLNTGLWRYTRHPNYFGECCLWWGIYLLALGAGGWWAIASPLLMSFLLLKVSGVGPKIALGILSGASVDDFYFTNPIARCSAVMAECSAIAAGRSTMTAAE